MRRRIEFVKGVGLLAAVLMLAASEKPPCICPTATNANVWCEAHAVGYVATVPIWSKELFEAIDAHGHEIERKHMRCATCLDAIDNDEYCVRSKIGYVGDKAYLSRLTYLLATGRRHDAKKLTCKTCRVHATRFARPMKRPTLESFGWCKEHKLGWIGNIAYQDRDRFEETATEFRRLLRAMELADRCESCATASFYDTYCPVCRIQYRDGRPVDGHGG